MHICFFGLPAEMFNIWRRVIYRWKGLENTFPTVYYTPQNLKKTVEKRQRKIHSCLVTVDQGGQKKRNGKSSNINYQRIEI